MASNTTRNLSSARGAAPTALRHVCWFGSQPSRVGLTYDAPTALSAKWKWRLPSIYPGKPTCSVFSQKMLRLILSRLGLRRKELGCLVLVLEARFKAAGFTLP